MGNSSTKESRADHRARRASLAPDQASSSQQYQGNERPVSSSRNRPGRADANGIGGILGISSPQLVPERRETRQEREARRLERERQQRLIERERSLREEHIDGGYLVTLGTYVGPEDYNKQVVRQLQIERKLAPFWRGLQQVDPSWAEHQIIAAARGLEIPPADQPPPEHLIPRPLSPESPEASTPNLNNLTVPIGGRSQSVASDKSASNAGSTLPSQTTSGPAHGASSPFKPRTAKALAAAIISSRNGSTPDIVPHEIHLPNDPFVNGQPLEVYLYKNASECPICFLEYPPYLNHTRCCDQPICSECFVQIKRADPHYPEGHGDNPENAAANPEEQAGMLISEPACCPYCQQPELGVTYEPPPFRRGLAYSVNPATLGVSAATAMSSNSSLNSTLSPPLASPTSAATSTGSRRRTQSLSVNAPNVITTDRVRPDWSTKLASQRAHIARRAAAATALHTAAFLMGNNEARGFRVSRFGRRSTVTIAHNDGGNNQAGAGHEEVYGPGSADAGDQGDDAGGDPANPNARRSRMDDLEELMFREALRQSLASEEERLRKSEKEARKEAKRREKQERKSAKAAAKGLSPYHGNGGSGASSASGSSLSLSGLGNRLRGNSGSNLRMEASVASAMAVGSSIMVNSTIGNTSSPNLSDKGKGVDRGTPQTETSAAEASSTASPSSTSAPRPIPIPQQPAGPSHLRQMSSASSVDSSTHRSYRNPPLLHDPRASGLSLGGRSQASEDADRQDDNDVGTESMFNFSSLAEMVGVELEGENAGRRLSITGREAVKGKDAADSRDGPAKDGDAQASHTEHAEDEPEEIDQSISTLKPGKIDRGGNSAGAASKTDTPSLSPPQLMITPETPAPNADDDESKQLGFGSETVERVHQMS